MTEHTEPKKRIELDDVAIRLRRNLIASAGAIIAIKHYDIEMETVQGAGVQLTGLNTENVLSILTIIAIYHAVTFGFRAIEAYISGLESMDAPFIAFIRFMVVDLVFPFALFFAATDLTIIIS